MSERLGVRVVQRNGMPDKYVAESAAHELGPMIFNKLLETGKAVVDIKSRKQRDPFQHRFNYEEPGVEHVYDVRLTKVEYDRIRIPEIEYYKPEPKVVVKEVFVDRVVEVQAPPPAPWWQRCASWIREEWRLAGTDPGERYVP